VLSVPDAVGIAIEKWMQDKQGIQQELIPGAPQAEVAPTVRVTMGTGAEQFELVSHHEPMAGACPDCDSQLEYAEGCMKCHVCGFGVCG
jgi:ribonucleoside-diphosphate reductase alpha chain